MSLSANGRCCVSIGSAVSAWHGIAIPIPIAIACAAATARSDSTHAQPCVGRHDGVPGDLHDQLHRLLRRILLGVRRGDVSTSELKGHSTRFCCLPCFDERRRTRADERMRTALHRNARCLSSCSSTDRSFCEPFNRSAHAWLRCIVTVVFHRRPATVRTYVCSANFRSPIVTASTLLQISLTEFEFGTPYYRL